MARDKEADRSADVARLDKAIDAMLEIIGTSVPSIGDKEADELNALVLAKGKVEAAKALPALFARRAALLGLDQQSDADKGAQTASGTLAELEQKLRVVANVGGNRSS